MSENNTAIDKALTILLAFIPENQEMGTLEISKRLGLNNATASRILLTLAKRRFLQQNPKTRTFKLGQSALLIGRETAYGSSQFNHKYLYPSGTDDKR
jgi:IclR family KDG regulon transcriptional repressor